MTNALDRFAHYALAFEQAFATDDWGPLAEHFTDGAVYETFGAAPLAGRARGRTAVVDRLRTLVGALDRRFDLRLAEILAGPDERDGGAWMRFGLTLRRAGLPDLRITGDHTVYVEGARIGRIEEYVPVAVCDTVAAYLEEHEQQLLPARSGAVLPLGDTEMRRLVDAYAAAKSRQDVDAALALCGEDFMLETVALGIRAHGAEAARMQLGLFFHTFPDYAVTLDGMATADGAVSTWGRARMTFGGPLAEIPPTGRSAELPIFCVFTFGGGRIASERFFFDLATLCEQTGIPLAPLRAATAQLGDRGTEA